MYYFTRQDICLYVYLMKATHLSVCAVTAEELWRGVLAETGAGARKGRGKRTKRKLRRDLNRGQNIGEGKTLCNMCFCLVPHLSFLAENVFSLSIQVVVGSCGLV